MVDGWQFLLVKYPHRASQRTRKLHYIKDNKVLCGNYGKLNLFKEPDIKTEENFHNHEKRCCVNCKRILEAFGYE